jgi:hypothetical protein
MQHLHRVNVIIHAYMTSHAVLPNIVCVHKCVEIKMEDGSKPLYKFNDPCRVVMWLSSMAPDGTSKLLFDAIVPVVSGQQQGSMIITYCMDNTEAAALIWKIRQSVAGWFFGYWWNVMRYRLEMVNKLMERFDIDAAFLAQFSEFNSTTLTVTTTFRDVNKQLESIEVVLGIDQGWYAGLEGDNGNKADLIGHWEALMMTLQDRVEDVDNAVCSGPSR